MLEHAIFNGRRPLRWPRTAAALEHAIGALSGEMICFRRQAEQNEMDGLTAWWT